MSDTIIQTFKKFGFEVIKEIEDKNKRLGAGYWILSKDNEKYLLKAKDISDKRDFLFDKNISSHYSDYGYPKVCKMMTIGKKIVTLVSYQEGTVISEKSYTNIQPKYFGIIESFFDHYIYTLKQNSQANPGFYKTLDHKYLQAKIVEYKNDIRKRFGVRFDGCIDLTANLIKKDGFLIDSHMAIQHGDCYGSNMIIDSSGMVKLIDWESIKYASIYFDLGLFIAKHALDKEFVLELYTVSVSHESSRDLVELLNLNILFALFKQLKNVSDLDDTLFASELFQRYTAKLVELVEYFCEKTFSNFE